MTKFKIQLKECNIKEVSIEAETSEGALEKAKEMYSDGEILFSVDSNEHGELLGRDITQNSYNEFDELFGW